MDPEAVEKVKKEEILNKKIGILPPPNKEGDGSGEALPEEEEGKEDEPGEPTSRSMATEPLPGEREKPTS